MRVLALLFAVGTALSASSAMACSCRAPGPPCESMFSATVFVGKVTKTAPLTNATMRTTFEVLETLNAKTPLGKTVELDHLSVGSMCGLTFAEGTTYVVYAGGRDGKLSVGACSRTHLLTKKDEDVEFAHRLGKRDKAVVNGLIVRADGHEQAPIAGAVVKVKGREASATIDPKGAFSLDLEPGSYELELVSPSITQWRREPILVEVPHPAACPRPEISVAWNGTIRGKVTSDGAAVAGLNVHALAKKPALQHWNLLGRTGDDGSYEIHGIEPGTFFVVVSPKDSGGPSADSPYPTTWAPGVGTQDKAKSVTIGKAGTATIDLELPARLQTHRLEVLVKKANGEPQRGAVVNVIPTGGTRSTGGATNEQGRFELRELGGLELTVRACMGPCVETRTTLSADAKVELMLK